jgi:hypothetical protein
MPRRRRCDRQIPPPLAPDRASARLEFALEARARHQFISNQYIPGFWEGAAAITSGAQGGCIVESTRETSTF